MSKDPNELKWVKVKSSQLEAVSFVNDEEAIYIKFKNRDVWKYSPFTFSEFGEFINSDSVGSYFHSEIKTIKTSKKIAHGNRFKK